MTHPFLTLAEAAAELKRSEHAVITRAADAADNLRVCFHYRGNLAGYAKGQNPQLFRCWFDGYLRSRTPVRLRTETNDARLKIVAGRTMVEERRTIADTLSPGAVDVVKNLTPLPGPPALGKNEYLTRLGDDGNPISTCIPKSDWLFHIDDLRALSEPASSKDEQPEQMATPSKPMQRQRHQEGEILRVIGELGYSANALPKSNPGKTGVKKEARDRLKFSVGVFDKAWERLRSAGEIKNAE